MKQRLTYIMLAGSLVVVPLSFTTGCAVTRGQQSVGEYTSDKTITAKVKTALLKDPAVKGRQVNVTTYEGVVQLSGFVDSAAAKERAGEIARATRGVQTVHNDLLLPTGR
jgi:osmotically-inducible protein OsmY